MQDTPHSLTRRDALKKGALLTGSMAIGGTALTGSAAAGIGDGRVGHYTLNNLHFNVDKGVKTEDHVHDASPQKNHGVWHGVEDPIVKGPVGNAFAFDGNSSVEIESDVSSAFGDEVTIAAWVKPAVTGSWRAIAALNDYSNGGNSPPALLRATDADTWGLYLDTANGSTGPGGVSGGTVELDTWTHVAGTYDGTTARVFQDGAEVASEGFSGALDAPVDGMFVGVWQLGGGDLIHHWNGDIDEARIYNRALSETEIQELVAMGE